MNFRVSRCAFFLFAACIFTRLGPVAYAEDGSPAKSAGKSESSNPDYNLQPQDVIKVQVFQEEDINKQAEGLSISQDSTVNLPLIGTLNLKGKTVRQAEEMIRTLYDRDYIVNPQVTVTVLKYAERIVNVIGAVNKAGPVSFPQERGLNIVDAISLAGGQNRYANLKKVKLTRGGAPDSITVDVDAIMKGGGEAVQLLPGDTILVPEKSI
jgi:polysaccharide biosynthesis/export protein